MGQKHIAETRLKVRFAETDMMGIAHHANYLVYFEVGRITLSNELGAPYAELEKAGFSLAVSEVQLRYKTPAVFDQELTILAWMEKLGSRGLTIAYEVLDAASRDSLVTGATRLICVDRDGQVRRIPPFWFDAMQKGLGE
jgi:acyl-CoA thioester hydrolase